MVHRLAVDPIRVYPLTEFSPGGMVTDRSPGDSSWFDQLVDGDLNMFIALISAMMVLLGAVLIIRPKDRAAPQPWEMGTLEVEMEEEQPEEDTVPRPRSTGTRAPPPGSPSACDAPAARRRLWRR